MKDILRAFFKAGLGTGANMAIGLVRTKYLAIHLGPQGMGLISMLQQFQATLHPVASLGGDAPLVQGLASTRGEEQDAFLTSALVGLLASWVLCTLVVSFGGHAIGSLLLGSEISAYPNIVPYMAIPMLATAISSFLLAILTTAGAVGSLQKGQLLGNLAGLIAAMPLGLFGGSADFAYLISFLAVTPLVTGLFGYWYIRKIPVASDLLRRINFGLFRRDLLARFFSFGAVTIVTGFAVTATWLFARKAVLTKLGPDSLGLFSATVTLSGMGLSLLSTALSSFYLPQFASADPSSRPRIVRTVLLIVALLAASVLVVIQLFPETLVRILFAEKFLPMIPLLRWWIAGDTLRAISYVFAIPIFAAAHLKFVFITEILFSSMLLFGWRFVLRYEGSIENLGYVYFGTYILYLITVFFFAKNREYI